MKAHKGGITTTPINEQIRFAQLQVISEEGKNLGVISREEALKLAEKADLDLVLIAQKGSEGYPIAKIMDFGKALYAKKKQLAEAKKHQKIIQIKEIKLRPKIGLHDFQNKMNQAVQFLKGGKHVKISIIFRGREIVTRDERGQELFSKIDDFFAEQNLEKVMQEKDAKAPQIWSRVYYLKK